MCLYINKYTKLIKMSSDYEIKVKKNGENLKEVPKKLQTKELNIIKQNSFF